MRVTFFDVGPEKASWQVEIPLLDFQSMIIAFGQGHQLESDIGFDLDSDSLASGRIMSGLVKEIGRFTIESSLTKVEGSITRVDETPKE